MLETLARLVAFPTIAGEPNGELIAYVAERLGHASILPAHRNDAVNLHAVLGPADEPGGLLLAAHSDVVGVEGQPWSRDPFALHVQDGRAYGRGTADMKGFLATMLDALEDLDARRLRRPLHLAVSSDEELGCRGVRPLLDTLARFPLARGLVGEPTGMRVADRHKGKAAVRIHVRGVAAHSSLAPTGVNAVACAGRLIVALLELQDELAAGPTDDAYSVPYATVGIGPIAGGVSVNIVPDHCRLDVEVRALPEQDPQALIERVRDLAAKLAGAASISFEPLSDYPGLRPSAHGFDDTIAVDFGTEAGLYQQRLGIPVVVCGPGSIGDAHQADEFVELQQLERSRALVTRLAEALCE
jgi:acetylornithine deacetylase